MKWPFYQIPDGHDSFYSAPARMWHLNLHYSTTLQPRRIVYIACWGGGHNMLARFGLVGINQLCSLKLPQSPCSQGNGGRKGENSPRVRGHEALRCWINGGNSPSEAKTDANSGLLRSRRSRPACISPIVSADPAVNVNAAAVRCCINATAARSKLNPPSRLQSQPHRTLHSRGHISPRPPCYGDPLLRGETMQLRRNKG